MATTLSKEEYLKKYLNPVKSGDYKKKKKKRGDKVKRGKGMRIVDDDVSWKAIAPNDSDEDDIPDALLIKDEKPQVEVVDNRTEREKILDGYRKSNKWKTLDEDERESAGSEEENVIKIEDSASDMDVPRKNTSASPSNKKRHRHDSDSDMELPRQKTSDSPKKSKRKEPETNRKASASKSNHSKTRQRHDSSSSDSDLNLPRSKNGSRTLQKQKNSKSQQSSSDSDIEVPRPRRTRHDSDSDLELPRQKSNKQDGRDLDVQKNRSKQSKKRHDSDSSTDERKKMAKKKALMNSGGVGGLTNRSQLKKEIEERKKKESDIDKLANDTSKNATIFREKGGKKRNLRKEQEAKDAEDAEKAKRAKKYDRWGKGIVQDDMKSDALDNLIHESNKPLARYRDDADLDAFQRSQVRDGDPMAEYLARKKTKETAKMPSFPKYRGPAPAPNRYHVQPGYRWDGVNRSNGFEKKYYESLSAMNALKDEAYKWSVEDM